MTSEGKDSLLVGIVVVFFTIVVAFAVYGRIREDAEERRHQDIVCFSGSVVLFVAEDVAVYPDSRSIRVVWPDGRQRVLLEGNCEWAPTNPESEYDSGETQSWRGPDPDRGVRWAWRNTRSTSTAGRSLRAS